MGGDSTALQNERSKAMDYYQAKPFGNEVEGRSSVVSTDVRDTVEWIMPTLMRIFTSGEETVEFEPQTEADVPFAKQATEYVNYIWNRDNPGFLNFYTLFKDGLLQKNGVGKVWWDDADQPKRERFYDLDEMAYAALVNADDVTVSEHTEKEEVLSLPPQLDPETGALVPQPPQPIKLHDVVITRMKPGGRVCVHPVPPEHFLISRDGHSIAEARFVGDRSRTTISDLRKEGVKEELISKIGATPDSGATGSEEIARNTVEDETAAADTNNDASAPIWRTEGYIKADVDGDGIAEMRKVTVAGPGNVLLSNEPWDGPRPYFSVTPIIMPHRFWGLSIADLVMDLQLIRSTIFRQYLDNLYLSNNQRTEVVESAIIDPTEVLSSRPGGVVRVKVAGSVNPIAVPQIGDAALAGLEYVDNVRETRTGVSERTQGLAENQLHKTAGGERMLMSAAMGKIELIARVFAETGVKEAFKLILCLVCRYQQKERVIRLTDQWVPMDPRGWNEDMDVSMSVGMGTGDKDQRLQHAMLLGQMQQAALPLGMATPENFMATAEVAVNAMGFKSVDRFFTKPKPGQPPPPNPEMMKVEAQTKADMAKMQADGQIKTQQMQQEGQIKGQQMQLDAQIRSAEMEQEFALKKYQIDAEMALKREQIAAELQLKREEMAAELQLKRHSIELSAANDSARIASSVRAGGAPG